MSTPRVTEIRPGIWAAELATRDFEVRAVALLGSSRILVFDTLLHPSDMHPFADLAEGREVVTVYTHADWDHVWGTAGLPGRGGEVVAHEACAERFAVEVPATLEQRRSEEPGVWDDVELVVPTTLFETSLALGLAPWTVELHHCPGHTRDSVVAWIPEAGVLLCGDAVEDPWPLSEEGLALDPWIASLERWLCEPALSTVIPSHGPISGRELLERNIDYLTALRDGRDYPVPVGVDPFYVEHYERDRQRYGG